MIRRHKPPATAAPFPGTSTILTTQDPNARAAVAADGTPG